MTMTGTGATTGERNGVDKTSERALNERGKAVDAAILAIEKQFGRGSIMKLGSSERQQVDFIPTGSIALDLALGVGGVPRGRITEIFGPESSGKTTVCQHIRPTLAPAVSTSTSSWSASQTPASRRSRSPRPSSARVASTASSSTRWRRSCRARRSRARWVTRSSASRLAS